jgi:zinc transport system substrate-binding protein
VRLLVLILVLLALAAAGCGGSDDPSSERAVVAAFYPLAWAVESITRGTTTVVVNLTPPGAEPHDVELTPRDVKTVRDADLAVYLSGGFQPAVEDAVAQRDGPSLDVVGSRSDPHVWLDPPAFAGVFEKLAPALGAERAAGKLVLVMRRLDAEYRRGLADCDRRTIVTTHAAFGQLARRYGLTELSLAGRSPESEPSPRELEDLIEQVRKSGATTVFAEPLVSDRVAETVAREAGLDVGTLDPIEGLSQNRLDAGEDYLSVMRANLAALREALGCR